MAPKATDETTKNDTIPIDAAMRGDECPDLGEPSFDAAAPAEDAYAIKPEFLNNGHPIHEVSGRVDEILGQRTREGKARIFRQNGRLVHIVGKAGKDTAGISTVTHSSFPVREPLRNFLRREGHQARHENSESAGLHLVSSCKNF